MLALTNRRFALRRTRPRRFALEEQSREPEQGVTSRVLSKSRMVLGACAARAALGKKIRVTLLMLGACAIGGGAVYTHHTWRRLPDAKDPGIQDPGIQDPGTKDPFKDQSRAYLGSHCNAIDGSGCNPTQLPMYTNARYIPTVMLKTTDVDVAIDAHERISEITSVKYNRHVSEHMGVVARSFGLNGGGLMPTDGGVLAFSTHFGHSELIKHMGLSDMRAFYAKMSRTYTVFSAELRPQRAGNGSVPFKYQPSFDHDVRQLPDGAPTDVAALEKWQCFFDKWGTHYVKSVTFGGELAMRTFIDKRATADTKTKDSNWNFNLDMMFRTSAGLPINFTVEVTLLVKSR